ncbi:uncharacterized protein LY89DRAFT_765093 [Mollisia scopiformis]|uniref:Uncharacterized protein n=1 Tax=Mollisia scopiformis TaxID=149040 RepID=A0A132B798_MOLSC|nr:uncharacterized protein LY89DRAFT_765093 [Mollisia scopiformis]KUJ08282.1 hypothetical protein LY89DRAFT_765093 [Mollisia scopiformis]
MSGRLRPTALVPAIIAMAAFALTLVLVLAGRQPNQMSQYYLLSMNTSHLGDNIIQFNPTTAVATPAASKAEIQPRFDISHPIQSIGSGLDSIFSGIGNLTGLGNLTSNGGPITGITNAIEGIITNITNVVDGGLTTVENNLVQELMQSLGVKDCYNVYAGNVCSGNYTNTSDPNAAMTMDNCPTWGSIGAGLSNTSIPSSISIATVNVSVPILQGGGGGAGTIGSSLVLVMTLLSTFQIIGLVGSGILALGSLASVIMGRSRLIAYTVFAAAGLAFIGELVAAILITVIAGIVSGLINSVGSGVSLYVTSGKRALAFAWVSAALVILANIYWLAVWFVDFRRHSLKVRRRGTDQIGNWKGLGKELLSDLRSDPSLEEQLLKGGQ